ncbi:ChbG/HpnK family deacetylase [Micropruina sp.]|uniref:ChbG/HpnK family deacetylase n=1 Tax=Micropruina sp. TaxID=2737536 RepID=UPI0026102D4D|nr:ChbG/HpnK family deacetylase [Micropruina sp.]
MTQLLVIADDMAMTHGTTLGILDSIDRGIVRNTGIFANCDDAELAGSELKSRDQIDVGIDLNFVTGRPLLGASEVPSLVESDGAFRPSRRIRAEGTVRRQAGPFVEFDVEPFDYDETLAEARAQLARFREIMGRNPVYLHHHSLITPGIDAVFYTLAREMRLPVIDDLYRGGHVPKLPNPWYLEDRFDVQAQADADPKASTREIVEAAAADPVSLLFLHPGYVDAEVIRISTYSVIRAQDLDFATHPSVADALTGAEVELTTFTRGTSHGRPIFELATAVTQDAANASRGGG